METRYRFPRIDPQRLGKSFFLRQARRKVNEIVERFGEENIRYLIENNKDIDSHLTAEQQQLFRRQGKNYAWLNQMISDADFIDILPPWSQLLIASYGEKGERWLKRQLLLIREFITL